MSTIDPNESFSLKMYALLAVFCIIITSCLFALLMTSCTISFQNISTNGYASDLVDENQEATPDIKTDIKVPTIL